MAILLGAEINAEAEHQTDADSTVGPDRPLGERMRAAILLDGSGQDLTVYGSDTPTKDGAAVLGTAKGATGEVTITVPAGQGKRPYIVVWFTNSPRMFGGNYAALSEISLS